MRRQLAMRYLREREMAICEVAYLLGFSESSSFHRAFKRWTGLPPKEFRSGAMRPDIPAQHLLHIDIFAAFEVNRVLY